MATQVQRPATEDALFLWVMHRFGEVFGNRAILKGGMALRLQGCQRSTTDIDYVFVPFESKNDIRTEIEDTLRELEAATIEITIHSTMLRAYVSLDDASIQVEAAVAMDCASQAVATAEFARSLQCPSQIIRVVASNIALANKLAAWNERRLLRDLYDIYFLFDVVGTDVDRETLLRRLARMKSRLPALREVKSMTLGQLASELDSQASRLENDSLERDLKRLLPPSETAGLASRIRSAIRRLTCGLRLVE